MCAYGTGILRRWARRMWLAGQPKCLILGYHRVADLSSDPQLLSVTPQHFVEHLEHVRRHYQPMTLVEISCALAAGRVPRRALVITFDDGYADNLRNAKRILEQYDIPATVFVTTGYVGQDREFWWDELEKLLLLSEKLPERLELNINEERHEWRLDEHRAAGTWNDRWNVTMEPCPSPSHEAYRCLHRLLRPLEDRKRQQVLTKLARWAEVSRNGRPDYLALDSDELKMLGNDGLVEIGSHTMTHPVLSEQATDIQQTEIIQSKQYLEEILGRRVDVFSYPYGGAADVGDDTIQLVREAGYKVACANFAAAVTSRSDPYWLPRFLVRDWDGDEFARRLRGWSRV